MNQVRTFQIRLPRGDHEDVLDAWGDLAGRAIRYIHVRMAKAHREMEGLAKAEQAAFLREEKNALKRDTIKAFGISGRQYNGLFAQLMGLWESRRELAKVDVDRLKARIDRKRKAVDQLTKRLEKDRSARKALAEKSAAAAKKGRPEPLPTKSQARALLDSEARRKIRFSLHQGKRKLASLEHDLEKARASAAKTSVPRIVFGGKGLMRERLAIHPNDAQSLAAWRRKWSRRRSAGFMLIGGSDEAYGNKSCKMMMDGAGRVRLDLRLPDGLGLGKHLSIGGIEMPDFGRPELEAAMRRNLRPGNRIALTYRFVRDPEFRSDRLSAWRVCITVKVVIEELAPAIRRLGVDTNADHLALALIDGDGNPLEKWRIPLPLRGKTSGQRAAIIGDAAARVCAIAREHDAGIVLEALDFGKKKKELADARKRALPEHARYARMLSSLAYRQIGEAIQRRAEREGIAVDRVNPAYTSLIGEVNFARRYGMTRHQGAAVAIARRACGFSERINYIHGHRGRRSALPSPEEARRHVWRHWAVVHRERSATAASARREHSAHPSGRGKSPGSIGQEILQRKVP
ncbi:MAG: hypothetical protein D6757_02005 [Alphaproteobacteria bacterium]|nr:MAG: hypothetical protein D6757_02005 [Alphaproteobacteria bacterium]